MTTEAEALSVIRSFIREELTETKENDLWVIAKRVARKLAPDVTNLAVKYFLHEEVKLQIQQMRHALRVESTPGESRWARIKADPTDVLRYFCGEERGYQALGDMTIEDCQFVASEYFARAHDNEREGKRFERLAETLLRAGKKKVRQLPKGEIEGIFTD